MNETTKLFNDFLKLAKNPEKNSTQITEMLKQLGEYNLLDDLITHTCKKLKNKKECTEKECLNYYNALLEYPICIKLDNPKQEMKMTKINNLRTFIEDKFTDSNNDETSLDRLKNIQKIYFSLKNFSMHVIPTNLDEVEELITDNILLTDNYLNNFIKEKTAEIKEG